jgi:pimeloyl-ACP methyl ester carboxylesterase
MNSLHIEQLGSGPRVIMIHGGEEAGGAVAFANQTPLAKSFTLLLPDLPGHGKTPAQGPANPDLDASLIAELLTEKTHLVGHSYGGSVALRAAVKRPEMIRSLTLVEPSAMDIAAQDPEVMKLFMELVQAVQIPDLRERAIAFGEVLGIHKDWPNPLNENYRLMSENLPNLLKPNPNAVPTRELVNKVVAAGIPSLVISGGHRVAWEHICDILAEALHAERAVISGFKHNPPYNGADFNKCVEDFWAKVG